MIGFKEVIIVVRDLKGPPFPFFYFMNLHRQQEHTQKNLQTTGQAKTTISSKKGSTKKYFTSREMNWLTAKIVELQ